MEPVYFDANGQGYYIDEVEALENLKISEEAENEECVFCSTFVF